MRNAIFITGTDTGIGKTVVTGLLADYISSMGMSVITQKWIETGSGRHSKDVLDHLKWMKKDMGYIDGIEGHVSPYRFKFPSSPHLAARIEKRRIDTDTIKRGLDFLKKRFDYVLAEGIGGSLVPLNKKRLVIDLAEEFSLPAVVVAGNRLGAINHTLLTVESLIKRRIKIIGIVFNNLKGNKSKILSDNSDIVKAVSGQTILGSLPFSEKRDHLRRAFLPVGKNILRSLERI